MALPSDYDYLNGSVSIQKWKNWPFLENITDQREPAAKMYHPQIKKVIGMALFCLLTAGCAAISNQSKMGEYERTMYAYDTTMRLSDFNAACQFVSPTIMEREDCLERYDNLKIVNYKILDTNISEDKKEVRHKVETEYYLLDRGIVKKIKHEQTWRYVKDRKTWMLQTPPPKFE